MTSGILKEICSKYIDSTELKDVRDLTVMLLSFSGFLRFDEVSSLKAKNVKFENDHLILNIESSKTDQFREGQNVFITKGESVACPWSMAKRYLRAMKANICSDPCIDRKNSVNSLS